uniref:Uncharacterized protein n=1 Tax=Babesia sp. Dunhuang TaxID=1164853 RepID=A0A411AD62_9APIC|nr:hypothetical protein [Babesia sp. Xinjiang]QAX27015.1 hypothetical protein [Babesia sp. Dunhuang]
MTSEQIIQILNPIAIYIKYILDIIADILLYILENIKEYLELYLSKHRLSYKQQIFNRLYGALYALIQIIAVYINLPFHILSPLRMVCAISSIHTLTEMKIYIYGYNLY